MVAAAGLWGGDGDGAGRDKIDARGLLTNGQLARHPMSYTSIWLPFIARGPMTPWTSFDAFGTRLPRFPPPNPSSHVESQGFSARRRHVRGRLCTRRSVWIFPCGECGKEAGGGDAELATSGDAELDELRRLAVKAPIEELVQRRLVFMNSISGDYRSDPTLWKGIERLCDHVLASPATADRKISARLLAQVIERADSKWRDLRLRERNR